MMEVVNINKKLLKSLHFIKRVYKFNVSRIYLLSYIL